MFEHFLGKFSTLRKIVTCYLMAMMMMMVVVVVVIDMIVLTCYLSIFLTMCWMSLGSSGMMLSEFGRNSSGWGTNTGYKGAIALENFCASIACSLFPLFEVCSNGCGVA